MQAHRPRRGRGEIVGRPARPSTRYARPAQTNAFETNELTDGRTYVCVSCSRISVRDGCCEVGQDSNRPGVVTSKPNSTRELTSLTSWTNSQRHLQPPPQTPSQSRLPYRPSRSPSSTRVCLLLLSLRDGLCSQAPHGLACPGPDHQRVRILIPADLRAW